MSCLRTPARSAQAKLLLCLCLLSFAALPFLSCNRKGSANSSQSNSSSSISVSAGSPLVIRTSAAEFRLFPSGYLQAALLRDGKAVRLDDPRPEATADALVSNGKEIGDFVLDLANARISDASGRLGARGKRIEVLGKSPSSAAIEKTVIVEFYDDFPNLTLASTSYKNSSNTDLPIDTIITQKHTLNASLSDSGASPYSMWSFHGSSEAWGKDDVMKISNKFSRSNAMQVVMHNDENQTGGGIPVVAFWTGSVGEAIGHAETVPLKLSLPVRTEPGGRVSASVVTEDGTDLQPGQTFSTPLTFVSVFQGDFYAALSLYSRMLQVRGVSLAHPNAADYEANWCGWGYEMDFTPKQMLGTIPKLKQLGLKWATLGAGWFRARGDSEPATDTFPDYYMPNAV